jgi:hypothetical protein
MCSVSGDDNCVNAEEEVGGWDPLPDIIWYVRPSANSRRLKKKWEGRIGADEWKDSKGVFCIAVDIWQKGVKSDTRKTLVDTTTELFLLLPLIFFPLFFLFEMVCVVYLFVMRV